MLLLQGDQKTTPFRIQSHRNGKGPVCDGALQRKDRGQIVDRKRNIWRDGLLFTAIEAAPARISSDFRRSRRWARKIKVVNLQIPKLLC